MEGSARQNAQNSLTTFFMWFYDIHIQTYFAIAAGIAGLSRINFYIKGELLIIAVVFINIIVDLLGTYMAFYSIDNLWCYNISSTIENTFILILFSLNTNPLKSKMIKSVLILMLVFSIVNMFYIQKYNNLNTYTFIPASLFIVYLSYSSLLSLINTEAMYSNLLFWFSLACFIYYSLMITVLSALPLALEVSYSLALALKQVNNIGYMLWSVLLLSGFLWTRKKTI